MRRKSARGGDETVFSAAVKGSSMVPLEAVDSGDAAVSDDGHRARNFAIGFILTPILITLIWGLGTRLTRQPVREASLPPLAIGFPAPSFTFPLLGGGTGSLADHKGKVILVNVWATWCPPCIDEMPSLQRLHDQMRSEGEPFVILAVSIDVLGEEPVRKWVDRFNLTFPILLDPRGNIKKLYRTKGVPETFIIGPNGQFVQKIIGPREWDSPQSISFLKQVQRLKAAEKIRS